MNLPWHSLTLTPRCVQWTPRWLGRAGQSTEPKTPGAAVLSTAAQRRKRRSTLKVGPRKLLSRAEVCPPTFELWFWSLC